MTTTSKTFVQATAELKCLLLQNPGYALVLGTLGEAALLVDGDLKVAFVDNTAPGGIDLDSAQDFDMEAWNSAEGEWDEDLSVKSLEQAIHEKLLVALNA